MCSPVISEVRLKLLLLSKLPQFTSNVCLGLQSSKQTRWQLWEPQPAQCTNFPSQITTSHLLFGCKRSILQYGTSSFRHFPTPLHTLQIVRSVKIPAMIFVRDWMCLAKDYSNYQVVLQLFSIKTNFKSIDNIVTKTYQVLIVG